MRSKIFYIFVGIIIAFLLIKFTKVDSYLNEIKERFVNFSFLKKDFREETAENKKEKDKQNREDTDSYSPLKKPEQLSDLKEIKVPSSEQILESPKIKEGWDYFRNKEYQETIQKIKKIIIKTLSEEK